MTAVAWRLHAPGLKPLAGTVTNAPTLRAVVTALCGVFGVEVQAKARWRRLSRVKCRCGSERCRFIVTFERGDHYRSALLTTEVERWTN